MLRRRIKTPDVSRSIKRRILKRVPGSRNRDRLPRTVDSEGATLAVGTAIALPFVAVLLGLTWSLGFWSLLLIPPFFLAWRVAQRMSAASRLPLQHEWRRQRKRRRALRRSREKDAETSG